MACSAEPFHELQRMQEAVLETVGVDRDLIEYYECRLYSHRGDCYETLYFEVEHPCLITVKSLKGDMIFRLNGQTMRFKELEVIKNNNSTLATLVSDKVIDLCGKTIMKCKHALALKRRKFTIIDNQSNETLANCERRSKTMVHVDLLLPFLNPTEKVLILSMVFKTAIKKHDINNDLPCVSKINYLKDGWSTLLNLSDIHLRKVAHLSPNESDIYMLDDCKAELFVLHYDIDYRDTLEVRELHSDKLLLQATNMRFFEGRSDVVNHDGTLIGHFSRNKLFDESDCQLLGVYQREHQSHEMEKYIARDPCNNDNVLCTFLVYPSENHIHVSMHPELHVNYKALLVAYAMKLSNTLGRIRKIAAPKEVDSVDAVLRCR